MTLTARSLAVTTTMVLGVMAFWPNSQPLPVMLRAVAQGTAATTSTTLTEPTVEENNAATERKLEKRIPAQFEDASLRDVLAFVFNAIDVDHVIRTQKLVEEGIDLEQPVNLRLKQIRAEMLLDLVLTDAVLTFTVRDGIVIISTHEDHDVSLEIRIYNVRDLVTMTAEKAAILHEREITPVAGNCGGGGGGGFFQVPAAATPTTKPGDVPAGGLGAAQPNSAQAGTPSGATQRRAPGPIPSADGKSVEYFEPLVDLIKVTVDPESWDQAAGGQGSAMQYDDGLLVINQSPRVHKKISGLLKKLRELRGNNNAPPELGKVKR